MVILDDVEVADTTWIPAGSVGSWSLYVTDFLTTAVFAVSKTVDERFRSCNVFSSIDDVHIPTQRLKYGFCESPTYPRWLVVDLLRENVLGGL